MSEYKKEAPNIGTNNVYLNSFYVPDYFVFKENEND